MTILLVEDDHNLSRAIVEYFELEDIQCDYAGNGATALMLLSSNTYQVVILDINLPSVDGLTVCETIRKDGNDVPVIMLTAKDTLEDKLEGFKVGTDDYLVKPFSMDELVARVKALSSRVSRQTKKLRFSDLTMDLSSNTVTRGPNTLTLAPTALKILKVLLQSSPNALSRDELISKVWGEYATDRNTLQVHIHNLRKSLSPNGEKPLVHTIKGHGYILADDYEDKNQH